MDGMEGDRQIDHWWLEENVSTGMKEELHAVYGECVRVRGRK